MSTIYQIAKWTGTFETAESRRIKTLPWVSIPIGFSSNGYQLMVDQFEDEEAAAIYGAWVALVMIAATCEIRGILATSRGVGYSAARLSRISHFPESVFQKLLKWASSPEVGWLQQLTLTEFQTVVAQRNPSLRDETGRNGTGRYVTSRDGRDGTPESEPIDRIESDLDWGSDEVQFTYRKRAERLFKVRPPRKGSADYEETMSLYVEVAYLSLHLADDWFERLLESWRGNVRSPKKWLTKCAVNECESIGVDWDLFRINAPKFKKVEAK
jgi:hypothetical protein